MTSPRERDGGEERERIPPDIPLSPKSAGRERSANTQSYIDTKRAEHHTTIDEAEETPDTGTPRHRRAEDGQD